MNKELRDKLIDMRIKGRIDLLAKQMKCNHKFKHIQEKGFGYAIAFLYCEKCGLSRELY